MMFFWISSVPPAIDDMNDCRAMRLQLSPFLSKPSSSSVQATIWGPTNSCNISRTSHMMLEPCNLPSEPPGPGALPAFISARVRIATSDLAVSSE